MRRGATVVALDYDAAELKEVRATRGAMIEAGEIPADAPGGEVNGDALRLPFPDATFDRIIASEVLEHLWDDAAAIAELVRVLRPGGRLAVTVPDPLPGARELGDQLPLPRHARRARAHLPPARARSRSSRRRASGCAARTTRTRCTRPTGG